MQSTDGSSIGSEPGTQQQQLCGGVTKCNSAFVTIRYPIARSGARIVRLIAVLGRGTHKQTRAAATTTFRCIRDPIPPDGAPHPRVTHVGIGVTKCNH